MAGLAGSSIGTGGSKTGALATGTSGGVEPLVGSLLGHCPAIAARPPSDITRIPAIIFQRDDDMV